MPLIEPDRVYDIKYRGITNTNLSQFKGVERELLINVDDKYRPIIMDGTTIGGRSKVALLSDFTDGTINMIINKDVAIENTDNITNSVTLRVTKDIYTLNFSSDSLIKLTSDTETNMTYLICNGPHRFNQNITIGNYSNSTTGTYLVFTTNGGRTWTGIKLDKDPVIIDSTARASISTLNTNLGLLDNRVTSLESDKPNFINDSVNTTYDINPSNGDVYKLLLSKPSASITLTGSIDTDVTVITIYFVQGTGSNTVSFPNNVKFPNGSNLVLSFSQGSTDVVQLVSLDKGTTWLAQTINSWL